MNSGNRYICGWVAATALTFGAGVEAAMYKWVDENGQTHYTQERPPPGIKGTTVEPAPEPPSAATSRDEAQKLQERLEERLDTRAEGRKKAADDAAHAAEKASRCEAARQRLEKAQRPRTNFVEADGTQRRATDEEREEQVGQAEKQVKEFCG